MIATASRDNKSIFDLILSKDCKTVLSVLGIGLAAKNALTDANFSSVANDWVKCFKKEIIN